MSYKFFLSTIVCAALVSVACSSKNKSAGEVVITDGGYNAKGEIVINDASFAGKDFSVSGGNREQSETTKIAADGSQINTMYDGFGNRTDTRCFNYHLRVKCVLLRVAAGKDGQKQVFVYASNGEVKTLPDDMLDRALTLTAEQIAAAAGITQDYIAPPKPMIVKNYPSADEPLKPLPGYNFPVRAQAPPVEPVESVETPANDQPDEPEENSPEAKSDRTANPSPTQRSSTSDEQN